MLKKIILLVGFWAVLINLFALVAWNRIGVTRDTAYAWIDPRHLHSASWNPLKLPARWDSEWYLDIARNGYVFKGPDALSNLVFFPVYPVTLRVIGWLLSGNLILAGWIISLAALCGACLVLASLVRDFHKKIDPEETIFFLLIFPTAIFFSAIYTEALFLLLSVSSIYLARRKKFWWSAAIALIAALTRVTGVLLFIPLALEYWDAFGKKKFWQPRLLSLLAAPLGLASFFAFHWIKYGDPLLFFKIEDNWGRSFNFNTEHFAAATDAARANLGLDILFVALALCATVYVYLKVRKSYAAYMLATIAVATSTGTLMSIGRYSLVLFPIFIAAAGLKPLPKKIWTLVSILLLGLYTTLFAHSYWAG